MHYNKTHCDNELSFLPFAGTCKENDWFIKVKDSTFNTELNNFQKKVLKLVLSKENWDKSRYSNFRKSIVRISSQNIKYCGNSICRALSTNDDIVEIELKKFAELQEFYPFTERIKDTNTGKYIISEKEINVDDIFLIINEILKKICSFTSVQASKLLSEQKDVYAFIDLMLEILDGKDSKNREKILKVFDKQFDYLKQIDILSDIYYSCREDYLKMLLNELKYHVPKTKTYLKENIDIFTYTKKKRAEG